MSWPSEAPVVVRIWLGRRDLLRWWIRGGLQVTIRDDAPDGTSRHWQLDEVPRREGYDEP